MPYAKKEDRASAVRKHYAKNKDEVLKTKVINRILQGKVPQARSLERFDITEDMVNEMRAEVGLDPIKIRNEITRPKRPPYAVSKTFRKNND
jgi:hypothetical protein